MESNVFILYIEEATDGMIVYHKKPDADRRFIGDWSTMRAEGDYYYDDNIKFVTPTDCFMYHNKYNNPTAAPIEGPSPQFGISTHSMMMFFASQAPRI